MSQLMRGIFGAAAVTLTLGAAQFAAGGDLSQVRYEPRQSLQQDINRTAKSDRSVLGAQIQRGHTVSVNLAGQSILVRIPAEQLGEARRGSGPSKAPMHDQKSVVACEPVVSVLTEVARQLQPGRCLT